jgi:hypothetical protein
MAKTAIILDIANGGITATGKGPWYPNPFNAAWIHLHLMGAASSASSITIEGTNDPTSGDGGPVLLYTSQDLSDNDTGCGGSLSGFASYVRYNCASISGTGAKVQALLSGEPR